MSFKYARVTYSTTGSKTISTTFQPNEVEIVVAPTGGTFTEPRLSFGVHDGTNGSCDSFSVWPSNRFQQRFTDRIASIWEYNGTTWVEAFSMTFTSWSSTGVTFNVSIASSTYQVMAKIRG